MLNDDDGFIIVFYAIRMIKVQKKDFIFSRNVNC